MPKTRKQRVRVPRPPKPATERQREVLAALVVLSFDGPPSASAIARHLGITTKGATTQLRALRAKGILTCKRRVKVFETDWTPTEQGLALLPPTGER